MWTRVSSPTRPRISSPPFLIICYLNKPYRPLHWGSLLVPLWRSKVKKKKSNLYDNIRKKRARIKAGSGERMKRKGTKGRPTAATFRRAKKTAKTTLAKKRKK